MGDDIERDQEYLDEVKKQDVRYTKEYQEAAVNAYHEAAMEYGNF